MSRLDDELDRLEQLRQLTIDAGIHAARISGTGPHFCIDCDEPIPQARREAVRGCELCIDCRSLAEHHSTKR
ncbi:TraR/DksA C4-type zinc finger protein [Aeromonas sp. sif2433]|uniref:TraR/DksA C4-type zinc finger protein n=1 Tax=Aeromonas sp. sif2433 TaxID=2854794 RepID=UPI001C45C0F7|nr:TraR/DksA C4-type zinc finger protein [Aeromonas sp. sif2433]MBV7413607.1 TraR/DksA C4-type zinc finger protein [Aeromonas sp. sif2433]